MQRSESIGDLAAALVEAQKEIVNATKDKVNPHFKSRYADLAAVSEACKQPLNDHGIAFVQTAEPSEGNVVQLTTALIHKSGQWISGTCTIPMQQQTPQAYGSALTYARRYGLAAMVGVCPDDDDAEGAEGRGNASQPKTVTRTIPPAAPKPAPPANDEDEKFSIILDEAFESREFPKDRRGGIIAKICDMRKIESIFKLAKKDRESLLKKIVDGDFDHLKNGRQPAGATSNA